MPRFGVISGKKIRLRYRVVFYAPVHGEMSALRGYGEQFAHVSGILGLFFYTPIGKL